MPAKSLPALALILLLTGCGDAALKPGDVVRGRDADCEDCITFDVADNKEALLLRQQTMSREAIQKNGLPEDEILERLARECDHIDAWAEVTVIKVDGPESKVRLPSGRLVWVSTADLTKE